LKMEPTQCSETSDFNTQTPGKYPEDNLSRVSVFVLHTRTIRMNKLRTMRWVRHTYIPCGGEGICVQTFGDET